MSVTIILLGITTYFLIQKFTPPTNQYRSFVISGEINPSTIIVGNPPQYVYVYYPYFNPDSLCTGRARILEIAKIKWYNNNSGKYSVYFNVPVGLKEVILTTDCSLCEYEIVNLEKDPREVNLKWGGQKCEETFKIPELRNEIITHARNFLNAIETNIVDKPFNSSEMQSIKSDIKNGRDAIFESDLRIKENINESLLQAYYAEWFAWGARYKIYLFELRYDIEKTNALLDSHKDSCYVPDHDAFEEYSSANRSYISLRGDIVLGDRPYNIKDIEKMKGEIRFLHNRVQFISDIKNDAENSLKIINGTFEFQKPYCAARTKAMYLFNFILLVVALGIGILIGQRWKTWIEK